MSEYEKRDIMKLDEDGGYYFRHVNAMTEEKLHSKSDIAAEFGLRDKEIDRLGDIAKAAIRYIDESPCDPDIYPEQKEAWNAYLRALSTPLKMGDTQRITNHSGKE